MKIAVFFPFFYRSIDWPIEKWWTKFLKRNKEINKINKNNKQTGITKIPNKNDKTLRITGIII